MFVIPHHEDGSRELENPIETGMGMWTVSDAIPEKQKIARTLSVVHLEHRIEGSDVAVYVGTDEYLQCSLTSAASLSMTPFTKRPASREL